MCNLYSVTTAPEAVRQWFHLDRPLGTNLQPMPEVWPTDLAPIVRLDPDGKRELITARWWLVPRWAKELKSKYPMFNARAETLAEKASFKVPFKEAQRCVVPADMFFEHPLIDGKKRRHWINLKDGEPMGFAGLWEINDRVPEGPVTSFTIVTTVANELIAPLYPKGRMPVILSPEDYGAWLSPEASVEDAQALLRPWRANDMAAGPVEAADAGASDPLDAGSTELLL